MEITTNELLEKGKITREEYDSVITVLCDIVSCLYLHVCV